MSACPRRSAGGRGAPAPGRGPGSTVGPSATAPRRAPLLDVDPGAARAVAEEAVHPLVDAPGERAQRHHDHAVAALGVHRASRRAGLSIEVASSMEARPARRPTAVQGECAPGGPAWRPGPPTSWSGSAGARHSAARPADPREPDRGRGGPRRGRPDGERARRGRRHAAPWRRGGGPPDVETAKPADVQAHVEAMNVDIAEHVTRIAKATVASSATPTRCAGRRAGSCSCASARRAETKHHERARAASIEDETQEPHGPPSWSVARVKVGRC